MCIHMFVYNIRTLYVIIYHFLIFGFASMSIAWTQYQKLPTQQINYNNRECRTRSAWLLYSIIIIIYYHYCSYYRFNRQTECPTRYLTTRWFEFVRIIEAAEYKIKKALNIITPIDSCLIIILDALNNIHKTHVTCEFSFILITHIPAYTIFVPIILSMV